MATIGETLQVIISSGPKDLTTTSPIKRITCSWGIQDATANGAPHSQYQYPGTQNIAKVFDVSDITGDGVVPASGTIGSWPSGSWYLDYDDVATPSSMFSNTTGSNPADWSARTIRVTWEGAGNPYKDFKVVIANASDSAAVYYQGGVNAVTINPIISGVLTNAAYATTEYARDIIQHDCDGFPGGTDAYKFYSGHGMDSSAYTAIPSYTSASADIQKNITIRTNNAQYLPQFSGNLPVSGTSKSVSSVNAGANTADFSLSFAQDMETALGGQFVDNEWYRGSTESASGNLPYWDGSNIKISVSAGEKAIVACRIPGLSEFFPLQNDGMQPLYPVMEFDATNSVGAGAVFSAGTIYTDGINGLALTHEEDVMMATTGLVAGNFMTPGTYNWTETQKRLQIPIFYFVFDCSACTTTSVIVLNDVLTSDVVGLSGSSAQNYTGTALHMQHHSSATNSKSCGDFSSGSVNIPNFLYEDYSLSMGEVKLVKAMLTGGSNTDPSFWAGWYGEKHIEVITTWWPTDMFQSGGANPYQPADTGGMGSMGDNGAAFNALMSNVENQTASSNWDISTNTGSTSAIQNTVHHHVYIKHPHACPQPESLCTSKSCDHYDITEKDCSGNQSVLLQFALAQGGTANGHIGNPVPNSRFINSYVMNYCDGVWNNAPHNMTCNCDPSTCPDCGADTINYNTTFTVNQHDCTTPLSTSTWGDIQLTIGALAQSTGPIRAFIVPIVDPRFGTPIHGGVTHTSQTGNQEVCFVEIPNNTGTFYFDENTNYTAHTVTDCERYLLENIYGTPGYNTTLAPGFSSTLITQSGPVGTPPDEGAYGILLMDANGCWTTAPLKNAPPIFNEPPGMQIVGTVTPPDCTIGGINSSSIDLTVTGAPYSTSAATFSWSGPGAFSATTQNLSGLTVAGTYNVNIIDNVDFSAPNCYHQQSFVVTDPNPQPTVSINCPADFCQGGQIGNITATATAGGSATIVDYHWYEGNVLNTATSLGSSGTNSTFSPPANYFGNTTIHVVVTDSNGCEATASCVAATCGSNLLMTASCNFYLDSHWACYGEDVFVTTTAPGYPICDIGMIEYSASNDNGATWFSYETLGNMTGVINSSLPYTTTTAPSWSWTGTTASSPAYLLIRAAYYPVANPGAPQLSCPPADDTIYIQGADPQLSCPSNANYTCWGATPAPLTVSCTNGYVGTFVWTDLSGTVLQTDTSASTSTYQPLANNIDQDFVITFSVTDASGHVCTTQCTGIRSIFYPELIVDAGGNQTVCEGSSLTLNGTASGSDGSNGYGYTWSELTTPWFAAGATVTNTFSAAGSPYTVELSVIDIASGCINTDTITVTVVPVPAISVTNQNQVSCGTILPMVATEASGIVGVFDWYDASSVLVAGNTNTFTPSSVPETYTVWFTSTAGSCSTSAVCTVTAGGVTVTASANQTVCDGETPQQITSTPSTGAPGTYSWSPATNLSSTTVQSPTFTGPLAQGNQTYTVTFTETSSGCTATDTVDIFTHGPTTVVLSISPAAPCIGDAATMTATITAATNPNGWDYTFESSVNGTSWATHGTANQGAGANPYNYSPGFPSWPSGSMYFRVVLTDISGLGCDQVVSNVLHLPEQPHGCTDVNACNYDPGAVCDDGSCIMPDGCTDPAACNYDPTATCDDGSCHYLFGCTDPLAQNWDPTAVCDDGSCIYCNPVPTFIQTDVTCNGLNDGTYGLVSVAGGTPPYTVTWSGPNGYTSTSGVGVTNTGLEPGLYTINILDANGCFNQTVGSINDPGVLGTNANITNPSAGLMDGAIDITVVGGTAPFTYSWTGTGGISTTAEDLSLIGPGTYTVVVTDANGCTHTNTWTLTDSCVYGCMDPTACNYDPNATCDLGCSYVTQPDPVLTFVDTNCEVSLTATWTGSPCPEIDYVEVVYDHDNVYGGGQVIMTIPQGQLAMSHSYVFGIDDCSQQSWTLGMAPTLPITPIIYLNIHWLNTATITTLPNTNVVGHNAGAPALISSTNNAPVNCGCTDPAAINYDATATCDCCCLYTNSGCTDDGLNNQTWWTDPSSNSTGIAYDVITGLPNYPGGQATNYNPGATVDDGSCLYPAATGCCQWTNAHFNSVNAYTNVCEIYWGSYLSCGWSPTLTLVSQIHHVQFSNDGGLTWTTTNTQAAANPPSINSYVNWQFNCLLNIDDFQNGATDGLYRVVIVTTLGDGTICTAEGQGVNVVFPVCGCMDNITPALNYDPNATCSTGCLYPNPCPMTLTLTPNACNGSGATVTVTGGTGPFTYVWEELSHPGVSLGSHGNSDTLYWWVFGNPGTPPFPYGGSGISNIFVCYVTDTATGCTEMIGTFTPVYSPQVSSYMVHVSVGDIQYCAPTIPATGGSYLIYPGTTTPQVNIVSVVVNGPNGYTSTLISDSNLPHGNYSAQVTMDNGCTYLKTWTIYTWAQIEGCSDNTACNHNAMAACDDGTCFWFTATPTNADCTGVGYVTLTLSAPGFVPSSFTTIAINDMSTGWQVVSTNTGNFATHVESLAPGTYEAQIWNLGIGGGYCTTVPFTIADNNVYGCMDVTANNTNEDCSGNTVVPTCNDCCSYCTTTVNDTIICIDTSTGTTGAISLTVGGGTAPYTYAWTGPNGYVATTQSIIGLSDAGTYICTITDANGCVVTYNGVVTDCTPHIAPGVSAVIITDTPCLVEMEITVIPGGAVGSATIWFTDAGGVDVPGTASTGFTIGMPQNFTQIYSAECTPTISNEIVNWTQWDLVPGQTYTPNISFTYQGNPTIYYATGTAVTIPMNADMVCGCMDVAATNTNADCTTGLTVVPTCDQCCVYCPDSIALTYTQGACGTGTVITATTTPAMTGTWAWSGSLAGATSSTNTITIPSGTGPVTATFTETSTACIYTDTITWTAPAGSVALGQTGTCPNNVTIDNGTVTQTIAPGTPPYTYAWTASGGGVVPGGQTTNQNLTGLVPGDYTCTVTDSLGCTDTATITLSNCCVTGCTDNSTYAFNYDPTAICTCNSGAPNDCCVYPDPYATVTQSVTPCNNTITITTGDNEANALADTVSATWQAIYDPAGANTLLLVPLPVPSSGTDVYSLSYIEDCSTWWQNIDGDYAVQFVITYANGHTETIISNTVTYARRICGCTDVAATNTNFDCSGAAVVATCDDNCCQYPANITCALASTINSAGCQETLTVTASDASSNTVASWDVNFYDTSGPTSVYNMTIMSGAPLNFPALVDDACNPGGGGFQLTVNTTYEVVVTATYTTGQTGTCTTNQITTQNFVCGCTDPNAVGYNAAATCDDGSCSYPCCDTPTFTPTVNNNPGACTLQYDATLNCNTVATDNAETVVTTLEFWDGAVWQTASAPVSYTPTPGSNAITGHTITYDYTCLTNTFGVYGDGDYRVVFDISYVGGHTCQLITAQASLIFNICGCTDPASTNYNPLAVCDDGSCISTSCCTPDPIIFDPASVAVDNCTPDLLFTATCNPQTVSHVLNWYMWNGSAWALLQTNTVAVASATISSVLPFALLHTTPGVSEVYKAEAVITYAASTCTIEEQFTYTPLANGCQDYTPGPFPDINGYGNLSVYDCAISTTIPTTPHLVTFPAGTDGFLYDNVDPCADCPGPCTSTNVIHIWTHCDTGVEYTFVEPAQTGAGTESNDYWIAIGSPSGGSQTIQYLGDCYDYTGVSPTATLGTIINLASATYTGLPVYTSCYECSLNYHEWKFCVCPSAFPINPVAWADCAEDIVNILGSPSATYPLTNTPLNNVMFYDYIVAQIGAPIAIGDVITIRHNNGVAIYCIEYMGPQPYNAATTHSYTTMSGEWEFGNDHMLVGPSDVYADCPGCAAAPDLFMKWKKCGTTDYYNIVDTGAAATAANTIAWVGTNNSGAIIMPNATWGPTIGVTVIKLSSGDCFEFAGYNTVPEANLVTELIDSSPTIAIELDCTSCLQVPGCTDPSADNFNFDCSNTAVVATIDDGCCTYTVPGCMDDGSQTQDYWDGTETWNGVGSQPPFDYATVLTTATYPGVQAQNYNALATTDDGSCFWEGCTDPSANNYVSYATVDDGSCNYCVYGCTDNSFVQFDPLATCPCNTTDVNQGGTGPYNAALDNDCCIDSCLNGCMDCGTIWENDAVANPGAITCLAQTGTAASGPGSTNFDPTATCPCCCVTPIDGCTDATALNYDPTANNDDGSCLYCNGFTSGTHSSGASSTHTATGFVIDALGANTATTWLAGSLALTSEDPEGSLTGTSDFTLTGVHSSIGAVIYGAVFDSTGLLMNSANIIATPGTVWNVAGLGWGTYTMVISHLGPPVYGVPQTCDNTFTFDIQTPACDDPTAFNTTVIPAQYVISDPLLCIPVGFCACTVTSNTVISTVCGTPSTVTWTMTCDPGTTINGFVEQSLDGGVTWTTVAPAITGFSNGFPTFLHTESTLINCQYRFTYTETTTPSCGSGGTVQMSPVIVTGIPICGCTDPLAQNYDPLATIDDGSCIYCVWGCTDPLATNYNPLATCDDGSCIYEIEGCTDPDAANYNSAATIDDGSCTYCATELWDCIPSALTSNNSCLALPYVSFNNSQGAMIAAGIYTVAELQGINQLANAEMALTALVVTHGINATFNNYTYQSAQPCGNYPAGCCADGFVLKKIISISHNALPGQYFSTWKSYIDAAIAAGVPTASLISAPATPGCEPISGYNCSIEDGTVSSTPSTATIISGALGSPNPNTDTIQTVACCTGDCTCQEVTVEAPYTTEAQCKSNPNCCL